MSSNKGIVIFSGGSAANNLVGVFENVRRNKDCALSYIIPISDNGGSSSELIRVFGGPGIGDVRSRLVRLIPTDPPSSERAAISSLFNHRLSQSSAADAATEWQQIVSGTSDLWRSIPSAKKELIRSFLNSFNLEILKRSRPPASTFDFTSASVGNLFLTGARLFSGSFESAIYLLSSICGIPDGEARVIPSINSNFTHHIAAGLTNGDIIVGQNNISHPTAATALDTRTTPMHSPFGSRSRNSIDHAYLDHEDANIPGTLPTLRRRNIKFTKGEDEDLPARIERVWYINPYGQEMIVPANQQVLQALMDAQAIIFSIGSLYTSIIPSIVLRGVGDALRSTSARHKILILNGSLDREVGPSSNPYTAFDFVEAIARAGEQSRGHTLRPLLHSSRSHDNLQSSIPFAQGSNPSGLLFPGSWDGSPSGAKTDSIYRQYVTHVIYVSGEETPQVDKDHLASFGIDCVRVYGRKGSSGMIYDPQALTGGIEAILGRKGDAMRPNQSRRNTLDA